MYLRLPAKLLIFAAAILALLAAVALPVGPASAQSPDTQTNADVPPGYDVEEAQRIDRMLMCPVCPGQTIDQARVEISRQMRRVVREMLAEGASRDQILQFFVDRYGTGVLAAPPKSGLNLVVWVVPVAGALAALVAALLVIRSMTGPSSGEPAEDLAFEDGLDPYLDVIDRDLAPDLVNDARPEVRRDRGS